MAEFKCQHCGSMITLFASPKRDRHCPTCGRLLHVCDNCQFFDVTGCVLEIPEPFMATHGTTCERFQFRMVQIEQTIAA